METDEYGTRPIKEEWLVTIAGPLQHIFIFLFLYLAKDTGILSDSVISLAWQYNAFILIGNLLPIWPLDGGRILQLLWDRLIPYKQARQITLILSCSSILICLVIVYLLDYLSLSLALLMIFLFWENRLEWKKRHFRWWRFLWDKHCSSPHYGREKLVFAEEEQLLSDVFPRFRRDCYHIIAIKNNKNPSMIQYISEKDCLFAFFEEKLHQVSIGEMVE